MSDGGGRRYVVRTLGCKANLADSQGLEAELRRRGWRPVEPGGERAGICIVNSCTVTDEADRQSLRLAARLGREHPEAAVVVTGCAAEVDPERIAAARGVHYVVGNRDRGSLVARVLARRERNGARPGDLPISTFSPFARASGAEVAKVEIANSDAGAKKVEAGAKVEKAEIANAGIGARIEKVETGKSPGRAEILGGARGYDEILSRHPHDREWPAPADAFLAPPAESDSADRRRTRAFLKIQEGCNAFCTYCIIPYGRGPSRSLAPDALLAQVRALVDGGTREIVLTGTNIGDYGIDRDPSTRPGEAFAALVARLLGETALERLRLSSLDPTELTPDLLALIEREPRLCPHVHVSLQSPHDRVLRLMKRRYGSREVRGCLEALAGLRTRAPGGVFVGMDVITGFPGEGAAEFEASARLLEELPWTRLHVFPYSERAGTPATRLPGAVVPSERARRARQLGALSLERVRGFGHRVLAEAGAAPLEGVLLEKPRPPDERGERWITGHTGNYVSVRVPAGPGEHGNRVVSVIANALEVDAAGGGVHLVGRMAEIK